MRLRSVVMVIGGLLTASAALAQDNSVLLDRISRMERDITFLQRQIYRGASVDPNAPGVPGASAGGLANMQNQLTAMQEEVRALRGSVERAQFQAKRAEEEVKKLSEDVEFRFQALERAQRSAAAAAAAAPVADTPEAAETASADEGFSPDAGKESSPGNVREPARYTPSEAAEKPAVKETVTAPSDGADAMYNNAFAMLNRKQYAQAAEHFSGFIRKYPSDPLVPNAYYWLGESHYARGDYVRATEQFRKGYEAAPQGQKAADNLLKLGLSLSNVKRAQEACVVLGQVASKYKKSASAATISRAETARAQLKCK